MKTKITIFIIFSSLIVGSLYSQWVQRSSGMGANQVVYGLSSVGTEIFAGCYWGDGVYVSTNYGGNWTATNSGLTNTNITSLFTTGSNLFAGTLNGAFLSTNNGSSWTARGLASSEVVSFVTIGNNLFAGTWNTGVFLSTNMGESWTSVNNGLTNLYVRLISEGTILLAGTYGGGVFLSTNNGGNWIAANNGLTNLYVNNLISNGINIFAGTQNGIFVSTNNGSNWITKGLTNQNVTSFIYSGINLFTGSDSGVFLSTNNGVNWYNKNQGFNNIFTIHTFLISNNFIFIGTENNSVWRRDLAEIIGLHKINQCIPSSIDLAQNYPNPFNPNTNIEFDLPKSTFTKLIIYDITGREIETLVNEELKAGSYKVNFDGSKLSSGVYFYKLLTNKYTLSRKMILIK